MQRETRSANFKPNRKKLTPIVSGTPFSYRAPKHVAPRLLDLVEATRRSKASFLTESLEITLPELETRYAPLLKALAERRAKSA